MPRPPIVMLLSLLVVALAGCGGVKVRPEQKLPKVLMQPMNVHAGLVLDAELRGYKHEETRAGSGWEVNLGPGHEELMKQIFGASFGDLQVFTNLDAARAATGLQVLFQPEIEQFSFATARETSASYWAVTIRYRFNVLSPQGEAVDTMTLTGYGSALGAGSSGKSLVVATQVAMRDAAAKFLVQMPRQSLARKLIAGQSISVADVSQGAVDLIEAVPIDPPS